MRVPVSLFLAAAALAAAAAPAQAQPARKDGLWEMTMKVTAPMNMNMTSRQCTDASEEKGGAAFRNNGGQMPKGIDCKAGPVTPAAGGGWSYSNTCVMRNMTMTTAGTAKGDFRSGYHIDSVTKMSPAPMPQLAEQHMSIDAKWLGPCPAGMNPGDVEINGKRIAKAPARGG